MSYEKHVSHLIDGAQELVHKLRNTENPDIQRLRDRVDAFVADAKQDKSERRARSMQHYPRSPLTGRVRERTSLPCRRHRGVPGVDVGPSVLRRPQQGADAPLM